MRPERRGLGLPAAQDPVVKPRFAQLQVPEWIWSLGALAVLLALAWSSLRWLRSGGRDFAVDYALALRSGFIFLMLLVPLSHPEFQNLPSTGQAAYLWLPLWYISCLRKSLGAWIKLAVYSLSGTSLSALLAGALARADPGHAPISCLAVFSCSAALSLVAPSELLSFYVATLSPLLVIHWSGGALLEENLWSSSLICYASLTPAALGLSAVTLLRPIGSSMATKSVAAEVSNLAEDTWRSLQLLLRYFQEEVRDRDLESLGLHLETLRCTALRLECDLEVAAWELCWQQHRHLRGLLHLLLRVLSVQSCLIQLCSAEAAPHLAALSEFQAAVAASLRNLTAVWWLQQSAEDQEAAVVDALEQSELADSALVNCLELLHRGRPESTTPVMQPAAFVDILREIPCAVRQVLLKLATVENRPSEVGEIPWLRRLLHSLAWISSVLWGVRFRTASPVCALLVSSLLPLECVTLDTALSGLLGAGGGVVLGCLPSMALRLGTVSGPHEWFACYTLMYVLWSTAVYYAQVQAFQWRVAALFWSCFGGAEMLRSLGAAEKFRSEVWQELSWDALVDLGVGCAMVFAAELIFSLSQPSASTAASECLHLAAQIAGTLQDSDGYLMRGQAAELLSRVSQQKEQLEELQGALEKRLRGAGARSGLSQRILHQCEISLLATRALSWSSARFGGPGPSALLLKALLPVELPQRLRKCAEAAELAMRGEEIQLVEATALVLKHVPESSELNAAAAALAMRGCVLVLCDGLYAVEAALRAEESLRHASWTPGKSSPKAVEEMA